MILPPMRLNSLSVSFLTELFSEAPIPTSIIMQCIFSHHMLSQLTIGLPCPILPLLNLLYNHCQSPLLCLNCGKASSTIRCHLIYPKIPTLVHSEEGMLPHPGLERGMNSTNSPDLLETPSVVASPLCTAGSRSASRKLHRTVTGASNFLLLYSPSV